MSWERIIRFEDSAGKVQFGEPRIDSNQACSLDNLITKDSLEATVFTGSDFLVLSESNKVVKVKKLLPLLSPKDVPIVKCIGLNYMKHSELITRIRNDSIFNNE